MVITKCIMSVKVVVSEGKRHVGRLDCIYTVFA